MSKKAFLLWRSCTLFSRVSQKFMDSGNQTPDRVKEIQPTVATGSAPGEVNTPVLQIGEVVAERYKVIELLGHGGMGSVYKVEQIFLKQLFALKTLSGQNFPDVAIRRFQKEAQAAMKLNHTNLVRAHDFGILPSHHPFYIMDLIEGENLSEYAKRIGTVPLDEILRIFIPVCFALAYAHSEGIVHRDIKPGNIMLEKSGGPNEPYIPKVVDFGIAKLTDSEGGDSVNLTRTGEIFGTPLYMSPEQCLGTKIDHRTDIYSLGCVLFEVLTGAPPFHGESALNLMLKHQSEQPSSLKEGSMGRDFPEALESIVAKTLEKDPDRRYQNLLELAEDLAVLQRANWAPSASSTLARTVPQIVKPAFAKAEPRSWKITAVVGFLCLIVGALGGHFLTKPTEKVEVKVVEKSYIPPLPVEQDRDLLAGGQYLQKLVGKGPTAVRQFKFPETFSIGELTYLDKFGNFCQGVPARGFVEIPLLSEIRLKVRQDNLRKHPDLLKAFGDYDVNCLHLEKSKAAVTHNLDLELDAALAYCSRWKAFNNLNIFDTSISDIGLGCVKECPNLVSLELINTKCTAAGVRQLKCFPNLATIGISGIKGGKSLIPDLIKSKIINNFGVGDLDITDEDVRRISQAKSLVVLVLRQNMRVTDKSIEYLKQLPKLNTLFVDSTSVSPKSMEALASLKNLEVLIVNGDLWTQDDLRRLQAMKPQLKRLEASARSREKKVKDDN